MKLKQLYDTVAALGFGGRSDDDASLRSFAATVNASLAAVAAVCPLYGYKRVFLKEPIFIERRQLAGSITELFSCTGLSFETASSGRITVTDGTTIITKEWGGGYFIRKYTVSELFGKSRADIVFMVDEGEIQNLSAYDCEFDTGDEIPVYDLWFKVSIRDIKESCRLCSEVGYVTDKTGDYSEYTDLSGDYAEISPAFRERVTIRYKRQPQIVTLESIKNNAPADVDSGASHLLTFLCAAMYWADEEPELSQKYYELYDTYSAKATKRRGSVSQKWLEGNI